MKYECYIVKDLMPLYIDDVLSENSKTFVKDHMDSCESCKKHYEKLSSEIKIPVSKEVRFSDLRPIEYLKSNLSKKDLEEVINVDTQIKLSNLSLEFAESLERLRPFGKDNPRPIFANKGVDIADIAMIGKDKKTMRMKLFQNGNYYNAIKFNAVDDYEYLSLKFDGNIKSNKIDIVYYPDVNEFRGNRTLQIKLIDIR